MKIDDEVSSAPLSGSFRLSEKIVLDLHRVDPVSCIVGADSSLEHNKSLHLRYEGEMPVRGYRCC